MTKFNTDELRNIFDPKVPGSGARSNKMAIENHALWLAMRKQARAEGILTPSRQDELRDVRAGWDAQAQPREYPETELRARAHWPIEKIREAKRQDMGKLAAEQPLTYAELQLARASFGLPSRKTVGELVAQVDALTRVPDPVPVQAMFTLSDNLAKLAGLEPGAQVPETTFKNLVSLSEKLRVEEEQRRIHNLAKAQIEAEDGHAAAK